LGAAIPTDADTVAFKYQTSISSISPTVGSIHGGTIITIAGDNFSPILSENLVTVGNLHNYAKCNMVSATKTELKCRLEKAPMPNAGVIQDG